jgi:Cys-tRNA(Pro)/Cys-tRNA(Cys) deacylase
VFKTLLARVDGRPVVAIVPVGGQLSLKELAAALGAKRAEMLDPADAQRITGYVVGGISPFGQRTRLVTVADESLLLHETVFVSGGRRGLDVEMAPDDLIRLLDAHTAPLLSASGPRK